MEKTENSNSTDILNQEFFDTIKNSKKINTKTQKIRELSKYFEKIGGGEHPPEIKNRIPDLFSLLLINLNENNNNYVLAQMELIQILGKTLNKDENYKTFIKQSLPKLFDKFYLGNNKINEILVKMFSEFIIYKILTIKDYYQYIENIPLEDEDNYRINILQFLYDNINKDESVLLNNIPKSLNEIIKKLVNDNESDISETASKILNILINRDIELNKKENNEKNNDAQININDKNKEDKGGTKPINNFVNTIVSAIKQNVENNKDNNNDNNKDNNIDGNSENKDNNIEQELNNDNIESKEQKEVTIKKDENKNNNELKEEINGENKINNDEKKEIVKESKIEEKKEETNNEDIKTNKQEIVNEDKVKEIISEEKNEEKILEEKENDKNINNEIKNNEESKDKENKETKNEENQEAKKEEKIEENKKEEKQSEIIEEQKDNNPTEQKNDINADIKKEEKNIQEKKEEPPKIEIKEKNEENKIDIKENKEDNKTQEKKENIDDNKIESKTEPKNEQIENKEIANIEETKEEKIDDKKENINQKEEINEEKIEVKKENNKSKDETKEKTDKNYPEEKKEENDNINPEKIIENKNNNDNIEKTEDISKNEINNTNIEQNTEKQKEENKNQEKIEEQPKKEETKIEETIKEEPKIIKDDKEKPEEKKELSEEKPIEEKKLDENIKKEIKEENKDNKEIPIKSNDNEKKKEQIEQIEKKNKTEIKKENKEEKTDNIKKSDGNKKTGIKSKISKFRKNFGKNKNKDGGFEFELVTEKKKDKENLPEDIKENIKEETNKEKENVEDKKIDEKLKEEIKKDTEENKPEENKKNEDIPKEEIKEEKVEKINQETELEKPKEEIKEEIKQKENELTPKNEEKIEKKEEITKEEPKKEEIPQEKPKEEIKDKPKDEIIKEKPKEEIKQEIKPKDEITKEEPKIEEIKQETKPKESETNTTIQETKPKEEIKSQEKISESNNKELPKESPKEKQITNTPPQDTPEENPETNKKSLGINQESLNEFEKKLQLALEQEAKDKNNNENLVDPTPAPIKQKKEDPKFDEIKSKLGKEIVDSLFSPKWETKKHGFELINEFINSNTKDTYNISELIEYMKLKLKNYKETNFNINREAINVYINMIKKKLIQKDSLINIIIAYHEKLSDIKLKDNLIELIKNCFDIIEPTNILKPIISKISKKNNAKLLIEYATFFGKLIEEYDVNDLPNKDIIDFCKILANNSNPQVRTSAISLLCILYKYLGKDVKMLTRDIKESTLKLIDAELDKVTVIDPKETLNKKKKAASVMENEDNKSGNNSKNTNKDLIPPQDISKKITPDIIKLLNSGKWSERKQGCETIEKILISANMRILPNGLNTLMTTIKKKLSDSNKNFVKMLIALLSKLIESMKAGFKQWAKPIALVLIPNLADKNQLMRNECQNCFDKWVEYTGFDSLVIHFPKFLSNDNVETRIEIMNFFMKHKDRFKNSKSLAESVYKDMMNPLLICLQDRSSNVRNLSEEIIKISLVYNPINNYYKKSEDFKPAITKTLKQILDKIKQESSSNNDSKQDTNTNQTPELDIPTTQSIYLNTEQNSTLSKTNEKEPKKSNIKSSKKLNIQTPEAPLKTESSIHEDTSDKDKDKNEIISNEDTSSNFSTISIFSNNKSQKKSEKDSNNKTKTKTVINKKQVKPKRKLSEDDLVNPLATNMNKQMPATSVEHLASNSTILRKKEIKSFQKNQTQLSKINNNTAVFLMNVKVIPNKTKRFDKDKKTKFNLETANKDYFIKLKEQCKSLFTEIFSKKIFSDDFRKQVEAFKDMKGQIDKKMYLPIFFDNLDLILKIIGIKILNNFNPTLMKNLFEFLDSLFTVLFENKYKLNETESNIIISILIDKLSLNNNTLREHCLSLLNKYIEFLETNKIMVTVINIALSKNNKIKTDILDLAIDLVSKDKLNISTKVYAKLFCKFLPFYENVIRSKTLSLFQEIYSNIGEELWNMIEISDKDREFLEENLCDDRDGDEDEEKEGEEEEDDEMENDDINNEINNSEGGDKNEILSNDKNENNNGNVNTDENKQTNKDSEKMKIFENKNGKMTKEDLDIILDNLLKDDPNEKLNTIILIHENICGKFEQNKEVLIPNVDKIITTFKSVSHKLFYMTDLNTIPIKFAKYLSIVFCKLASNKELISNLSYNILLDISRELLRYLLINGLDRIGDKQEGNIIFKSINSTVLRILENCDITFVISALLELIKEFYEKDDKNLVNLSIKCLLKSAYNLSQNIDNIKISQILLQIHLLLLSLQKKNKDLNKKSQTDALIINTVKNIVGEFVKYKKEKILEEYSKSVKNHQFNDKFLLKWIKAELEKS